MSIVELASEDAYEDDVILRVAREPDRVRAEAAAQNLLEALGVDLSAPDLKETPRRIAAMYEELLTPKPFNATTFPNDDGYDELVLSKSIPFASLCGHHALPFSGVAHVGYIPRDRVLGISKLARIVHYFSHSLQIQERLTKQVADWLEEELEPRGVGVVIEAEHSCMTIRGVRAPSKIVTSTMYGLLREQVATRQEFLSLIGSNG
ncbi:MAG TPA: GTP cyclohydrolase I FolE [Actinomycetota bacterium]|nr:GTP cyclohydrolase I FolE [Actinomycetota bacterium]